jgi:hypothetical protein
MTTIRRNKTYRHPNMLDVDMHVVSIAYIGYSYLKLNVVWVNRHDPNILWPDKVKLLKRHVKDWTEIKSTTPPPRHLQPVRKLPPRSN